MQGDASRRHPSRWPVAVLSARGIGFCRRVEKAGNTGFACLRDFLRSGEDDRTATLAAPDRTSSHYQDRASQQHLHQRPAALGK
jgi:hypothetical protein